MDLPALRAYLAVATRRNFSRAAMELSISQPAISKHVQKLEEEIGAKLIIRSRPELQLTALGEVLKWNAEQVIAALDAAHDEVRVKRGARRGVLRIGHTPSHRDAALAAVACVIESMPDIRVVLEELTAPHLEDRLLDHHIDVGLRGFVNAGPQSDHGLRCEEIGCSPFQLVVNMRHALAKTKKPSSLPVLAAERFALIRSGRHRQTLNDYFHRADNFRPIIVAEPSTVIDVLTLLRARPELVTIIALPTPHLTDLHGLATVPVSGAPLQRSFLLWPAPGLGNEAAKTFLSALHGCFRSSPR